VRYGVALFAFALAVVGPEALTLAGQSQAPRLTVAEIAKQNSPSIVTITTSSGSGSGVVIDPSGVIVTNLHVLGGETLAFVKLANGDIYDDVGVVDVDERKDLVLIKIKAFGLTAATMANSEQVTVGDKVTLIGSPRGLDLTVSDGLVSAIRDFGDGYRLFQTNAAASPGSSGGAMFNEAGQLVGIVTSKLTSGENLNFALPVNYVRGLLSTEVQMSLADLATQHPVSAAASGSDSATSAASSQASAAVTTKIAELFDASGLDVRRADDIWEISFQGDVVPKVDVVANAYGELLLISSIVATPEELTPIQMRSLLLLNYEADFGKIALDQDGRLAALNEADPRKLDGPTLGALVNAVALLADKAAGVIEGEVAVTTRRELATPVGAELTSRELQAGGASIRYDASEWTPVPSGDPEQGIQRNQFEHSSGELWAQVISERSEIPLDRIFEIGLANAREMDADAKLTTRGTRTVSGLSMTFLELDATSNGIPLAYYIHYYSDASGTYQLLAWTAKNLADEHRGAIESFVSGFQAPQPGGAAPSSNVATFPEGSSAGELQAKFGLIGVDTNGDATFAETRTVPNTVGQSFGWFIEVGALSEPISWTEEFTLPEAPVSWETSESQPNASVSKNRRTITIQDEGEATEGYIYGVWEVAEGDPSGPHLMRVTLSDGRSVEFFFTIE